MFRFYQKEVDLFTDICDWHVKVSGWSYEREVMTGEKRNTSGIHEMVTIRSVWITRGLDTDIWENQEVSVLSWVNSRKWCTGQARGRPKDRQSCNSTLTAKEQGHHPPMAIILNNKTWLHRMRCKHWSLTDTQRRIWNSAIYTIETWVMSRDPIQRKSKQGNKTID